MIDTEIELSPVTWDARQKEIKEWLRENNVKYEFLSSPIWINVPSSVRMSAPDATAFKLRFGLV
ncbi:MAG TPA: hypothetical protein VIY47_01600 [Ignavibacteriaceae bacterium]